LLGTTEGELIDVGATEAVLKTLTDMLGIKIDFEGLHEYASKIQKFMPIASHGHPTGKEEASYIG
jgi:proteasome assembly chaperone (PAC2) family protein